MFVIKKLLMYTLLFPIIGALVVLVVPLKHENILKVVSLNAACLPFVIAAIVWGCFQKSTSSFQFVVKICWFIFFNMNLVFGIDGVSLFFLWLTCMLIPLCLLTSWGVSVNLKDFLILFLFLDLFLIISFCILDLLLFYSFFESVLIPMYIIIGVWGSRERKVLAAYYFFLYTLFGSVVMLISVVLISNLTGSTDYELLLAHPFDTKEGQYMWFSFFLAFASKIPMMPFHLWLPEAHVEAPTGGSVILAGVLLKLGTYGFMRFSLLLFPKASFFFTPLVYTFATAGIIFASFTAIRQTDFKRIIAYTSIAHMNLIILGIFSFNNIGLEGAILQSLSHGFVASALFLVIGVVYDRYGTRIVQYFGGFASVMPLYAIVFVFFTMANISFPGTSSFVGEFLVLLGSFKVNSTITFLGATGIIIGGAYSLWLLNRIVFGNLKTQYTEYFLDLNLREFTLFLPLMVGTLVMGIYPSIFLSCIHMSVNYSVESFNLVN